MVLGDKRCRVEYIGGCISEGALKLASDQLVVANHIAWVSTLTLSMGVSARIDPDVSHWSREAQAVFNYESRGGFVDVLNSTVEYLVVDFLRDFNKPVLKMKDGYFSWHYAFYHCKRARAAMASAGELVYPSDAGYFSQWADSTDSLMKKLLARRRRIVIILPEPAMFERRGKTIELYQDGFAGGNSGLVGAVCRSNAWLMNRFLTDERVVFATPSKTPLVSSGDNVWKWIYHYDDSTHTLLARQILLAVQGPQRLVPA